MSVTIYHNPRCSKSRATLALLEEKKVDPKVIEYLKSPPSAQDIKNILDLLGMGPRDLMRHKEDPYIANSLDDEDLNDEDLINAMVADPILIERPIVVSGEKAAIGRPPEKVLDIL